MRSWQLLGWMIGLALTAGGDTASAEIVNSGKRVALFEFKQGGQRGRLEAQQVVAEVLPDRLQVRGKAGKAGTLRLLPLAERWDVRPFTSLEFTLSNPADTLVHFRARVLNPNALEWARSAIQDGFVHPGQSKTFRLVLPRPHEVRDQYPELKPFVGMNGLPGGLTAHWQTVDTADLREIRLEFLPAGRDWVLEIGSVEATHPAVPDLLKKDAAAFMPFVDEFGQYRYGTWPGKVATADDMKQSAEQDLARLKGEWPGEWDPYGGWAGGPKLKATGLFRTEKVNGRWWLVTPEGHLFWSHGACCVGWGLTGTPVRGREMYFAWLPPRAGEYGFAYGGEKDGADEWVDFFRTNLYRTFGDAWKQRYQDLTLRRMRDWGLNTIGAWSNEELTSAKRVPYTAIVHLSAARLAGYTFDVYRDDFRTKVKEAIAAVTQKHKGDPWCIGYFVDNELEWGGTPAGFIGKLFAADPERETKKRFVAHLKERFGDVVKLNTRLGTTFSSWDDVLASRVEVEAEAIEPECLPFYEAYCETYFKTVAETLKELAGPQMYLGARMHVSNPVVGKYVAMYADVISRNHYRPDTTDIHAWGFDKPVLISEFHFGALDRGMLGTGLKAASDQQDRADSYRHYVRTALENPHVVGTHWFAWCPEAITGRGGDGENYNIGMVDVTNQPYPELRDAVKEIGAGLYRFRAGQ